ncbi:hypothetical protein DTO027B5_3377 [Paecilomyces variotii]|nr:hypothetical protein DTO027B3_4074 [Paecilomyces variotii]KAJ9334871.1 hypothetical protein DTO027B5_3377 [Paecilomyces variotii]
MTISFPLLPWPGHLAARCPGLPSLLPSIFFSSLSCLPFFSLPVHRLHFDTTDLTNICFHRLSHPAILRAIQPPIMSEELTRIDSAVAGLSISPPDEKHLDKKPIKKTHRRTSSTAEGVRNINDLEKEGIELEIPIETQKLGWRLNTSPSKLEDQDVLKKFLVTPPVKKIDLVWPLGLHVTARNMKGVTIRDALDAIYKQFKKKADDELENPVLAGFEWDKEECWTRLIVHQKKEGAPPPSTKKSKKKAAANGEA